jgi:hypothetical protein
MVPNKERFRSHTNVFLWRAKRAPANAIASGGSGALPFRGVRSTLHAGGRGGKERAANLLAEQRLAPGGPQGSPDPERKRLSTIMGS